MPKISNDTKYPVVTTLNTTDEIMILQSDIVRKTDLATLSTALLSTFKNTTTLSVTGQIAASTNFSVTSSGVNYTKSGDSGDLLASAALFNGAEYIKIFLNGIYQDKGVHSVWVTQYSFTLDIIVDSGDEIIILS